MADYLKPPPPFVTNIGAWEYTLAKLANLDRDKPKAKPRLDEGGNPVSYAAAVAIYKHVCKKYAHFGIPNIDVKPINVWDGQSPTDSRAPLKMLNEYADKFPVGTMLYFDDVLCRAVERQGGLAVFPDPDGFLLIQCEVLEVDELGKYREWPAGKIFGAAPHRCFDLMEV